MKKQLELTPKQERECFKMREFFPALQRGHGSQHRDIVEDDVIVGHRCNVKTCDGTNGARHHSQVRDAAAAEYIIARDA